MRKILFLMALQTANSWAGPYYRSINFDYINDTRDESGRRCLQKIAGICVQWQDFVNTRTITAWNDAQKARTLAALEVVADRMLDPAIAECGLSHAKIEHHEGSPFAITSWKVFTDAVRVQMAALLNRGFAKLRIRIVETNEFSGQAYAGNYVDGRYLGGNNYSVTGEFNIDLARHHIDTTTPTILAGTISHEMLHQMAHSHLEGTSGYLDHNFIVVFQSCLENDGAYIPRTGSSLHAAGPGCKIKR